MKVIESNTSFILITLWFPYQLFYSIKNSHFSLFVILGLWGNSKHSEVILLLILKIWSKALTRVPLKARCTEEIAKNALERLGNSEFQNREPTLFKIFPKLINLRWRNKPNSFIKNVIKEGVKACVSISCWSVLMIQMPNKFEIQGYLVPFLSDYSSNDQQWSKRHAYSKGPFVGPFIYIIHSIVSLKYFNAILINMIKFCPCSKK